MAVEAIWIAESGRGRRKDRVISGRREVGGNKVYFRLSFVFFDLKAARETETPIRQCNSGGQRVTGQYGASLALPAATRQTDRTL